MAKSIAACLIVLMVLASTLPRASAAMVIVVPPPPATSMTLAAGGGLAVGIIATAAILCIYDVWLKINGYKNWDGTPKVQTAPPHHHR